MGSIKKATITAAPTTRNKDSNKSHVITTVKAVFKSGSKVTARELNTITGSNDARKQISDLRRDGWNIVDMLLPGGCKLYWLASDHRQRELFQEGGHK